VPENEFLDEEMPEELERPTDSHHGYYLEVWTASAATMLSFIEGPIPAAASGLKLVSVYYDSYPIYRDEASTLARVCPLSSNSRCCVPLKISTHL